MTSLFNFRVGPYGNELDQVPPQVRILPSKYSKFGECPRYGKTLGVGVRLKDVLATAYGVAPSHIVYADTTPAQTYDFIANLPDGNDVALQNEVRKKFGLVGRKEVRNTGALLLKVENAAVLQTHVFNGNGDFALPRGLQYGDESLAAVAAGVELMFDQPVVDATGLSGPYHLQFLVDEFPGNETRWSSIEARIETIKDAFQDELDQDGLELVPTNMPIEMIVVEKAE